MKPSEIMSKVEQETPDPKNEDELLRSLTFFETYGYFPPGSASDRDLPKRTVPEWKPVTTPEAFLEHVLTYIEPDGTVIKYEDDGTAYALPPLSTVNLKELGELGLLFEALEVASAIWSSFRDINGPFFHKFPETRDSLIRNLAYYLAPYRHNRAFLGIAVSLISQEDVDSNGNRFTYYSPPVRPERSVRAEQVRQALKVCVSTQV